MQGAGFLEAVHRSQFAPAHRELAVAALARLVDANVEGAVHRLELVAHILDIDGREHVLAVEVEVTAGLPQIDLGDVRGADQFVAVPVMLFLPVILDELPEQGTLGLPEDEARADLLLDGEELEILAELAVVALPRLLKLVEVLLQLLGIEEGGAVEPLQHGILLIPPPVGAGKAGQLEGLEPAGMGQMRPPAEVDEFAYLIERNGVGSKLAQQLNLVGLALLFKAPNRLVAGNLGTHKGSCAGDELLHPRLDALEVVRGEGCAQVEIVVEAVGNRGADGHLDLAAEEIDNRMGHEMGGTVAENLKPLRHIDGDRLKIGVSGHRHGKVDHDTIDTHGKGPLPLFAGEKLLERRLGRHPGREALLFTAAYGKRDIRHGSRVDSDKLRPTPGPGPAGLPPEQIGFATMRSLRSLV